MWILWLFLTSLNWQTISNILNEAKTLPRLCACFGDPINLLVFNCMLFSFQSAEVNNKFNTKRKYLKSDQDLTMSRVSLCSSFGLLSTSIKSKLLTVGCGRFQLPSSLHLLEWCWAGMRGWEGKSLDRCLPVGAGAVMRFPRWRKSQHTHASCNIVKKFQKLLLITLNDVS